MEGYGDIHHLTCYLFPCVAHHRPPIYCSKICPSLFSHPVPRFDLGEAINAAEAFFDAVKSRLQMNEFSKDGVLEDEAKEFNERLVDLQKRVTISASSAKVQLVKLGNLYSTHTALDVEADVQGHFQLQWENVCDRTIQGEVEEEVAESKASEQAETVTVEHGDESLGRPFDIGFSGTSS